MMCGGKESTASNRGNKHSAERWPLGCHYQQWCAQLYQSGTGIKGTMYGMLLESVQHFIYNQHGEESWNCILDKAGAKNTSFTTHRRYKDSLMVDLANTCSSVLHGGNSSFYMHYFGKCFVEYFTHYGYDKILRVSGRYYRDFLHGIDNLHETMRFSFPKMLSPSFYVDQEDAFGCILHYHSKRYGFTHYVIGQLQQSAHMFYNQEVEVKVLSEEFGEKGLHVVYRLNFDNSAFTSLSMRRISPAIKTYPTFSAKTFFKVFPFCIVFDEKMNITRAGRTLLELFKRTDLIGQSIVKCFTLRRPLVEFTWDNVLQLQNVVFELRSSYAIHRKCVLTEGAPCDCCNHRGRKRALLLKGQMRFMKDFKGVAFLCNPLINSLEDLRETGLYVNDLNMYDSSRHIVIAGYQHASSLEFSIEKQMEKTQQIADNLRRLDEWKLTSENLLYSMIPRTIADRLRRGEDPISTCESFEEVTVMFTYLIGFSEKCAKMSAQQLVNSINSIFTCFDSIVDEHQVLKVETVGDAVYMVAGGVPQRTSEHAQNVAAVALELREAVKTRFQNLRLRIGMHTGSVVAGVVGRRMPQYCLFGDTVNTASRMQTFGEGDRIHLSESCERCLQSSAEYVTIFRGRVLIKGKGYMNTYWLAGRRGDAETMRACKELRQETRQLLSLEGVSTLSNATVIDDNGMVEFPRRKKSDASIYEDLMKHQNKMQNRGDRRSVPNILAGLQGSFQILQERSESSISTISTASTDTIASPDESRISWLDIHSPQGLLRPNSMETNEASDDEDKSSHQGHDDKEESNLMSPLKPWATRFSGLPNRRRSSSESFDEFEDEEEDRNSLSDTEFMFVQRISCLGKSAKRTILLPRKYPTEVTDGLKGNSSDPSLTRRRTFGMMRRVSESIEDSGTKSPVLEMFAAACVNGYISSSSDDELGAASARWERKSPLAQKPSPKPVSQKHVTFVSRSVSPHSLSVSPEDQYGFAEHTSSSNQLEVPLLQMMANPSVKSLRTFFEQKSKASSGCPYSQMFSAMIKSDEMKSTTLSANSLKPSRSPKLTPQTFVENHESAQIDNSGCRCPANNSADITPCRHLTKINNHDSISCFPKDDTVGIDNVKEKHVNDISVPNSDGVSSKCTTSDSESVDSTSNVPCNDNMVEKPIVKSVYDKTVDH